PPISDYPYDILTATFTGPSRQRRRSLTTLAPVASLVHEALSPVCADLLPLRVDVEDSYESYTEPNIDPDVQADIDACIAFANDIVAKGMNVIVEIGTIAEEEAE
nr:hypothetical protein [Tanacetum cinerariifolium]